MRPTPRLAPLFLVTPMLVACSQPATKKQDICQDIGGGAPSVCPPKSATVPGDARGASEEERLAAIQKAMNELDEGAQLCWASAATERFDIAGQITLMVDIATGTGVGKATVVQDTARNTKLTACLVQLLGGYRWAPPLYSEAIQLPFSFKAPDGQSVIDRKLVERKTQADVSVAVLLDEANTGNPAASMLEVAVKSGASTGMRTVDRAELWYFLTPAELRYGLAKSTKLGGGHARFVDAGGMVFVPAGCAREVVAGAGELRAVITVFPGGREGIARAGALPATTLDPKCTDKPYATPVGDIHGAARIYIEPSKVKWAPAAASILELAAGSIVPEHVHAAETELLYILDGNGTMTIDGQAIAVTPTSVIQIPANTKHAFSAAANVRALQIYTPAGPEQRFKKAP